MRIHVSVDPRPTERRSAGPGPFLEGAGIHWKMEGLHRPKHPFVSTRSLSGSRCAVGSCVPRASGTGVASGKSNHHAILSSRVRQVMRACLLARPGRHMAFAQNGSPPRKRMLVSRAHCPVHYYRIIWALRRQTAFAGTRHINPFRASLPGGFQDQFLKP